MPAQPPRDAAEYRRLLGVLASRARRLGSRDPESAAQEALKRSLEHANSRAAVKFYFGEHEETALAEWPLDRLLAWLHAVLFNVVREERNRAAYRREPSTPRGSARPEAPSPAPDPLDALIRQEIAGMVGSCLGRLDRDYKEVLRMRAEGLKYEEIAARLRVNENTVATWVSRGIRELGRCVRRRMERTAAAENEDGR